MKFWRIKSLGLRVWLIFAAIMLVFVVIFGQIIYHVQMREEGAQFRIAHNSILKNNGILPGGGDKWAIHGLFTLKNGELHDLEILDQGLEKGLKKHFEDQLAEIVHENHLSEQTYLVQFEEDHTTFLVSYLGQDGKDSHYLASIQTCHPAGVLLPLLALLMMMLVVGFVITAVLANHLVKPLGELEKYAVGIAHKRWRSPLPVKSADEVGRLVESMNEMQVLLKQSDDEQRAFLQSISHDLKTPITVIMGHAQAILDGVYIESVEHTAEIIKEEALRLDKKVKKILYYNTLDYSLDAQNFLESVNLGELVKDLVLKFAPMVPGLSWVVEAEDVAVSGDYENFQVALENILDNALRYAQTTIVIKVTNESPGAGIEIYNDGETIEPDKIKGIFDQLAKGKKGNFGLGLFISQKIITHYGGHIWAENKDNGVSFRMKLGGEKDEKG